MGGSDEDKFDHPTQKLDGHSHAMAEIAGVSGGVP
jgi:hypothetical protein